MTRWNLLKMSLTAESEINKHWLFTKVILKV